MRAQTCVALALGLAALGCTSPRNDPLTASANDAGQGGSTPVPIDAPVGAGAAPAVDSLPPTIDAHSTPSDPPRARDAESVSDTASCPVGQHPCGTGCAANDDPLRCGDACLRCPNPAGNVGLCVNGACQLKCATGTHACGAASSCVADSDPDNCGPACLACPRIEHVTTLCTAGACAGTCDDGLEGCMRGESTVACTPRAWDFENGEVGKWVVWDVQTSSDSSLSGPVEAGGHAHIGQHALSIPISRGFGTRIHLELDRCSDGSPSTAVQTLSFWVSIVGGPANSVHLCGVNGRLLGGGNFYPLPDRPTMINGSAWTRVSYTSHGAPMPLTSIDLDCAFGGDTWTGTMYVDDVTLN